LSFFNNLKKIEDQKLIAKDELLKELSRQAAAHNNHLAQMLRAQEEELLSVFEKLKPFLYLTKLFIRFEFLIWFYFKRKLLIEREKIRDEFNSQVAQSLGRLKGIEHALNGKSQILLYHAIIIWYRAIFLFNTF
jgi:hypothetical protein